MNYKQKNLENTVNLREIQVKRVMDCGNFEKATKISCNYAEKIFLDIQKKSGKNSSRECEGSYKTRHREYRDQQWTRADRAELRETQVGQDWDENTGKAKVQPLPNEDPKKGSGRWWKARQMSCQNDINQGGGGGHMH